MERTDDEPLIPKSTPLRRGRGGRRRSGPSGPDVAPRGLERVGAVDQDVNLESASRAALMALRTALTDLMHSVGVDPLRPQDVSRAHGLNKNLTWKIARIVGATHVPDIAAHLPGPAAFDLLLAAMARVGAPEHALDGVRAAAFRLDEFIARHTGDRATLALMLEELSPSPLRAERLETARRTAFAGNSAIWGVQARARVLCCIVMPSRESAEPGMVDIARISSMLGFRRLRREVRWPLFQNYCYNDDGTLRSSFPRPIASAARGTTLSPEDLAIESPILEAFCSSPLPSVEAVRTPTGVRLELPDGPVGTAHAVDVVVADVIMAAASIHADEHNSIGSHPTQLYTPTAALMCDLLVHRDLPLQMPPEAALYSRLTSNDGPPLERDRLPLLERVQNLGAGPPSIATPLAPRHAELIQFVLDTLGWSLDEFGGWRIAMRYPPIAALLRLSYPLLPPR